MKITKKFYVGAEHIGRAIGEGKDYNIGHEFLQDAIAEARDKVRLGSKTVIVVQIVKVVSRDFPPIRVEDVD